MDTSVRVVMACRRQCGPARTATAASQPSAQHLINRPPRSLNPPDPPCHRQGSLTETVDMFIARDGRSGRGVGGRSVILRVTRVGGGPVELSRCSAGAHSWVERYCKVMG